MVMVECSGSISIQREKEKKMKRNHYYLVIMLALISGFAGGVLSNWFLKSLKDWKPEMYAHGISFSKFLKIIYFRNFFCMEAGGWEIMQAPPILKPPIISSNSSICVLIIICYTHFPKDFYLVFYKLYPIWSPDGMKIAYSTLHEGKILVAILVEDNHD